MIILMWQRIVMRTRAETRTSSDDRWEEWSKNMTMSLGRQALSSEIDKKIIEMPQVVSLVTD